MPRDLPPYVSRETVNGKAYYYFRVGKGKRIPLPAPNSGEFWEAYREALSGVGKRKQRATHGTLEWLITRYRESSSYRGLSPATRSQRDNIFQGVVKKAGGASYKAVTKAKIVQGREDRAHTPAQARNFLDAMRGLFRWAVDAELITVDPTAGVKNPPRPKGPGFEKWTDEEVRRYRNRWPLGTMERVWLEVLIGTGARRGDAVTLGRQHIRDGMIGIETQKEGVWAFVPMLDTMTEAIDAGPTGDLTFIVGKTGRNLTKETFGNMFRRACRDAGVGKSAHGLRKYAATAYAEAGLSEAELESVFGWVRGSAMAAHYSKTAERQKIATAAGDKIRNATAPKDRMHSPKGKKLIG